MLYFLLSTVRIKLFKFIDLRERDRACAGKCTSMQVGEKEQEGAEGGKRRGRKEPRADSTLSTETQARLHLMTLISP